MQEVVLQPMQSWPVNVHRVKQAAGRVAALVLVEVAVQLGVFVSLSKAVARRLKVSDQSCQLFWHVEPLSEQ